VGKPGLSQKPAPLYEHLIGALRSWHRSNGMASAGELDFRQAEETLTERVPPNGKTKR